MHNVISITNGEHSRKRRTTEEIATELSRLVKIRGIIRARSLSENDSREAIDTVIAEYGMPADVAAQLQTDIDGFAAACGPITDEMMRAAIDAQIRVLKERMNCEAIYDEFDEVEDEAYIAPNALIALDWLRGEGDAPSKELARHVRR